MSAIDSARYMIDTAIGDIENMLKANNGEGVAHYSAFILASCVIDYLAGYRYKGMINDIGSKYKEFVKEYLKSRVNEKYDEVDLYHYLRCGFVHSFTERYNNKSKFYFTHKFPDEHLKSKDLDHGLRKILDINVFLRDIKKAADIYFEEAENNSELLQIMQRRVDEVGTLTKNIQHR